MASYIANNASRDTVTIMLSKAEAEALHGLAEIAERGFDYLNDDRNHQTKAACERALRALNASTNTSARRAGFFDV